MKVTYGQYAGCSITGMSLFSKNSFTDRTLWTEVLPQIRFHLPKSFPELVYDFSVVLFDIKQK